VLLLWNKIGRGLPIKKSAPANSNQPTVLFSQNKAAPTVSHQPNEGWICLAPLHTTVHGTRWPHIQSHIGRHREHRAGNSNLQRLPRRRSPPPPPTRSSRYGCWPWSLRSTRRATSAPSPSSLPGETPPSDFLPSSRFCFRYSHMWLVPGASSRTGGSAGAGGVGASSSSAAALAGSQQRSQPLSQQSFSQGAGGSGGGSSLLHSQSQLSQGSFDESLLSLHLASPTRDQVPSASIRPSLRCSCVPIGGFCFIGGFVKCDLWSGFSECRASCSRLVVLD
jgi:hypothetical protein